MIAVTQADLDLGSEVGRFYHDPLGFVKFAYPWGEKGVLEHFTGPDQWQAEFLTQLGEETRKRNFDGLNAVAPIRMSRSSGHGIGKSTLCAWLVDWIMSTRPHSQGTITANTFKQLETKTWAQVQRWTNLCITSRWFIVTAERMCHRGSPADWFCSPVTCHEKNSEAFQGQHAVTATSFYVFDEASAVPDKIFEAADGGLTDGEPMTFAFGNATRSSGRFHRINFGSERGRWNAASIDSRLAQYSNKELIAEWVQDYGEDSDFVRVRVRGLPPSASDLQYISQTLVWDAQQRTPAHFDDDPLVLGLDIARGGAANTVFRFRRGLDAASIPPIRLSGEESRDSMRVATVLTDILDREYDGVKVTAAFVDSGFGGPIVDRCRQLGYRQVHEVSFGGKPPDIHFLNMRSWMWSKTRDFLARGSIDPKDSRLEIDLTGPGYEQDKQDKLFLESKEKMQKRGLDSPDDGDALALTFAQSVAPIRQVAKEPGWASGNAGNHPGSWMG